jgi:hypothetical protein
MEKIAQLVNEIRTPLLEAGMKPSRIAYRKKAIEEATELEQEIAVIWLQNFLLDEVAKYKEALNLVPEMTRQMYALSGLSYKTHEEKLMCETKERMFSAWKSRPDILQRISDEQRRKNQEATQQKQGSKKKPRIKNQKNRGNV